MKVAFACSEAVPWAKSGGLGDVGGALPAALAQLGHEVLLFLPGYRAALKTASAPEALADAESLPLEVSLGGIPLRGFLRHGRLPDANLRLALVGHDQFFDREGLYGDAAGGDYPDNLARFAFFCRGVLVACEVLGFQPDIVHAHDWQTALLPAYLKLAPAKTSPLSRAASLFTIHNLSFQGLFPAAYWPLLGLDARHFNWRECEFYGHINLMKAGLVYADLLTTVSPTYAQEICTAACGCRLEGVLQERAADLFGVLNGIDQEAWNPASDVFLPARYSAAKLAGKKTCKRQLQTELGLLCRPEVPLLGFVGRLTRQKGCDLLVGALPELLGLGVQIAVLGEGERRFHEALEACARSFPGGVGLALRFDDRLAHLIQGGADLLLMPSAFEPCGLSQMYAMRYGTVPVVRRTGGLADSVTPTDARTLRAGRATGFAFQEYRATALAGSVREALGFYRRRAAWRRIQKGGMGEAFSWARSARRYAQLYQEAAEKKKCSTGTG